MKKTFLKTALLTMAGVCVLAGSAMALPYIEGGIGMSGAWTPVNAAGVRVIIQNATGIDFGGYVRSSGDNAFFINTATGSFETSGLEGQIGTINDFQFSSAVVTPLWSVGGYSFQMTSYRMAKEQNTLGDWDLHVFGTGIMSKEGFETTAGDWNFTGQGSRFANYTWSASSSTDSSPVPEPATMLLFGSGLIGLALVGRKIRK